MWFPLRPSKSRQTLLAWAFALATILPLGILRSSTQAEYAFASAAIIPVCVVAWFAGLRHGLAASAMAAAMWIVADFSSGQEFTRTWIPAVNGLTRLATYVFAAYMTAKVRTLLVRETELATRDALTGLLNRRAFNEFGSAEASRARRYGHDLAVVFLDLDNFKELNDTRGHPAGDAALQAVATALKSFLRSTDRVARLGGDEIAILLPEIGREATEEAVRKVVSSINMALADYPPVSASVGVAWFNGGKEDFETMLKAADELMYEIKREGKSSWRMRSYGDRDHLDSP